eukprot:7156499-Pyramimonas_sp.AAC.1
MLWITLDSTKDEVRLILSSPTEWCARVKDAVAGIVIGPQDPSGHYGSRRPASWSLGDVLLQAELRHLAAPPGRRGFARPLLRQHN